MNTNDTNRQKAHAMIDHIFKDLLPAQGMAERSEQIKLSHRMLDTMLNGGIALCDAGTGIGKTYAYLTAAAAASRWFIAPAHHYLHLQHRLAERRADGIPSAAVLHPAGRRTD
mgnify:CR=1 FL=1